MTTNRENELLAAYVRGANWHAENDSLDLVEKAAADYADYVMGDPALAPGGEAVGGMVPGQAVIGQIVDYAANIAWQAGVGSLETAGVIVSFLHLRPELLPDFMAGTLSAVDTGMLDPHNGCLSWHGQNGNVHAPDPAKARFPAPVADGLSASPSVPVSAGRVQAALIRNDDAGFTEFVTEDGPYKVSRLQARNVEEIASLDGRLIGFVVWDAIPSAGAGEAVAWLYRYPIGGFASGSNGVDITRFEVGLPEDAYDVQPLYAHPPSDPGERERRLEATLRSIAETKWDSGALDAVLVMIQSDARAALAAVPSQPAAVEADSPAFSIPEDNLDCPYCGGSGHKDDVVIPDAQTSRVEALERALRAAEEELSRIDCEGVTETRSIADAYERMRAFASRSAAAARSALAQHGTQGGGR